MQSKSQKLLFPQKVSISKTDLEFINGMREELKNIGFIIKEKDSTLVITAVPPECQEISIQSIIEDLIEQNKNSEKITTILLY